MKGPILTFVLVLITLSTFAQRDTSVRKNGFAIFGGLGIGGNGIKQGFSRGIDLRFHSGSHTICAFTSHTTENEADYNYAGTRDLYTTYNASNFGLTYGLGVYERHYSAAALIGIGSTLTTMRVHNTGLAAYYNPFIDKKYNRTCGIIGVQATTSGRFLGLSVRSYYNIFDGPSNYTILFGLEIIFK